ncbi:PINIT domain-containing protein [Mycena albidolilacea]|uniref:PINIT domain-containing protein n=1 Tax=Mycena albidolilacea TaxID=1033008 RepID=A0AAD7EY42_9AGAR|nr:PINIT domain-containing protein [Mycena albidolilacea]
MVLPNNKRASLRALHFSDSSSSVHNGDPAGNLMASASDVWADFDTIRHNIKQNTVDKLKQILSGFNSECGTNFSKSGKKQEIIDRIVRTLDIWRSTAMTEKWIKAKAVVTQVRYSGIYTNTTPHVPAPLPHNPSYPIVKAPSFTSSSAGPSTSSVGRYDPYAPPLKATASTSAPSTRTAVRFKDSPFFTVLQTVGTVQECPESSSATDRRQQTLSFNLTNEHIAKLKSDSSKYQLRLFCTSSTFYSHTLNSFRPNAGPCLIEFPPTCEVRVNNVQLGANLKGLKKKPGTAPPPDLSKYIRLTTATNKVELMYVNTQQPVQSKKFYLLVQLVETVKVETLVEELKQTGYKSSHDIRRDMISSMTVDEDIVAGPQKMSLKCPLSYMRVNTPCRSRKCTHSQCFDATSWYSVMEQTTTWLCPVCERTLDPKDLIVDGYVDEILKTSSEDVEDVIVEADGEWHTSDNKYGSTAWKAAHPPAAPKTASPRKFVPAKSPASKDPNGDPNGKRKAAEIVVLDSDDEDEGRVKRELSPSFASTSSANRSYGSVPGEASQGAVIDLTLDSDDDEPPARPPAKRTASEAGIESPTEQIWKKGRTDTPTIPRPPPKPTVTLNSTDYGRAPGLSTSPRLTLPPVPAYAPPAGYSGPVLPPVYSMNRGTTTSTQTVQLPPPNQFVNRLNRW